MWGGGNTGSVHSVCARVYAGPRGGSLLGGSDLGFCRCAQGLQKAGLVRNQDELTYFFRAAHAIFLMTLLKPKQESKAC